MFEIQLEFQKWILYAFILVLAFSIIIDILPEKWLKPEPEDLDGEIENI